MLDTHHYWTSPTYLGLQTSLQEILDFQAENVIQLHLALIQHSDPHQTPEQSVALEQSPGVLLLQGEEVPGGGPDLGQGVLHPPHLSLVPQPILANELQLLVETSLLEGPPGGGVGLGVDLGDVPVNHLGGKGLPLKQLYHVRLVVILKLSIINYYQ